MPNYNIDPKLQFKEGQSGNPSGRPKGILNKSTRIAKAAMEEHGEEIIAKGIQLAKGGNEQMIQFFARYAVKHATDETFAGLKGKIPKDLTPDQRMQYILQLADEDEISLEKAERLSQLYVNAIKISETDLRDEVRELKNIVLNRKNSGA